MSNQLNKADYLAILNYYDIPLEKNTSIQYIKKTAEDILANKLCKCIKKVQKSNKSLKEPRAIAICKESVIHKKGVEISRFSCKKRNKLIAKKGSREKLTKRKNMKRNKSVKQK
jgi:hypothetical protein